MLKVLSKIALSIGAILGIHFLEINKEKPTLITRPPEAKLPSIEKISSIDDIKLFEKRHNCFFRFVENSEEREFYEAKEFLKKLSDSRYEKNNKERENLVVKTVDTNKVTCITKRKVIFSLEKEGKFKFQELQIS